MRGTHNFGIIWMLYAIYLIGGCSRQSQETKAAASRLKSEFGLELKQINQPDEDGRMDLHKAVIRTQVELAELLLICGTEPNHQDNYGYAPLHYAAKNGNLVMAELLLSKEADINIRNNYGFTPLHWAVQRNHIEVAEALIGHGADLSVKDKENRTPFELAVEEARLELSGILHPLHLAARKGDITHIQALVAAAPDSLDIKDSLGRAPLHKAFRYDQKEAAVLLIRLGANENALDSFGHKPEYYAAAARQKRTGHTALEEKTLDSIDNLIYTNLNQYNYINIGLVQQGQIVLTKTYGNGDLNGDYVYGSVSKPVTATIIMQLVTEGKIESINDNIWKYSPRYRNSLPARFADSPLTVKHLLLHKSGIPHNNESTWKDGKLNLKFRPGTQDKYSTPGYGILGHILEDVTGMSFSEAVSRYIGQPVGADSFWAEKVFRAPGARVHSTIQDMALFTIGIMNNVYLPGDTQDNEVLQTHSGISGYGWGILEPEGDELTIYHGGSNGRPRAFVLIKPKKKLSVVILARKKVNDFFELGALAQNLIEVLNTSIN